ncbi:TPA: sulfate adenylyltransferase [Candidatus Poribacteria bacterium]|nr:sulfate adenylyltransferase [Candidatus Poribacteria bacterium]HEX29395.1 sulfate adenylyltransferase [Candidatus Poribacteria bacterium]
MIEPHGGKLVNRMLSDQEREEWLARADRLPKISVSYFDLQEIENIATGLFSPLTGFMCREDYESVLDEMRLSDGTVWSIPILLPIEKDAIPRVGRSEYALITDEEGTEHAVIHVQDIFERDKRREAYAVYKTTDDAHPGVARVYRQPEMAIGGEIWLLRRIEHARFNRYRLDPIDTRRIFKSKGWRTVVAFQTRNPIHRAHEYLQKVALEIVDGLFLNPLVGETKSDDIPAEVRMRCYETVLELYYPKDRYVMAVFPVNMRYAGPREAIFHAICRKNYGCTHIIIGRDHAGVGNYYSPYEAQEIFDQFDPNEIGIVPLKFEHAFYCRRCGGMATGKTCPHPSTDHIFLSGTKVREMLRRGIYPPPEFTRPEVAEILMKAVRESEG